MSDPIRLLILKKLTDLIKTVTPANGYRFDLSNSVFRGRKLFGTNDPMPMVSILEAESPDSENFAGFNRNTRETPWKLILQGWVDNDQQNPSDPAYILAAEVERVLAQVIKVDRVGDGGYPEWYMLGSAGDKKYLISAFSIGSPVVSPPAEQVLSTAHFYLPIMIRLVETLGQPYPNG